MYKKYAYFPNPIHLSLHLLPSPFWHKANSVLTNELKQKIREIGGKINKNRSQFKECQLSNLPNVSHQRLYTADLNNKGQLG